MKSYLFLLIIVSAITFFPLTSFAQGDAPADVPPEVLDTPVDGGILLLLAAGAGYGAKRYHNQKKKKEQHTNHDN